MDRIGRHTYRSVTNCRDCGARRVKGDPRNSGNEGRCAACAVERERGRSILECLEVNLFAPTPGELADVADFCRAAGELSASEAFRRAAALRAAEGLDEGARVLLRRKRARYAVARAEAKRAADELEDRRMERLTGEAPPKECRYCGTVSPAGPGKRCDCS